ncbi:ABC transporter substrate-binding protein [Faunimonas sp. B44]|uniref:ABC transporter substrate-binding protein n=1 Tax=Faunimonas sp. B44 TaxID=3461493 RepID=UPI00404476C5
MKKHLLPILAMAAALATTTASAKTLVFCSEGSPESLNPQLVTTSTGMNAARPMFNNLVEFAPGSTDLEPALAETWTISDDGREYTFHLRSDVPFHGNASFAPTRPLNADDVVFSLVRQWKEDHPYHHVSGASYDYFKDMGMPDLLESIERLDDRTVRIRLARPEAPFLANLAMPFNAILSAEYAEELLAAGTPDRLDRDPIGTGPFVFAGYQENVAVRYRAFDAYWRGRQPIDTLVFSITPNPAVRLTKLKAGECHVMAFPNPADAGQIESDPSLRLLRQEGFNIGYLALNTTKPPFDDARVRRAINMAIDKDAIVEAVYQGAGIAAKNPVPPTIWSYNDQIRPYSYDPAGARRLLVEAGHPEGLAADLWYMPVSRPYMPSAKRIAELIQVDLGKIGVRTELNTAEWGEYRLKMQAGEPMLALYGWTGDNGDPDNFLHVLLGCTAARAGGNNIAKWCDPAYDSLVTRAKEIADQAARASLYSEAQSVFHEAAPWVPLAHSIVMMATRANVRGFVMDPLGRHIFEGVDLE